MTLKSTCHSLGNNFTFCLLGRCWEISAYEQEPLRRVRCLLGEFQGDKNSGTVSLIPFFFKNIFRREECSQLLLTPYSVTQVPPY